MAIFQGGNVQLVKPGDELDFDKPAKINEHCRECIYRDNRKKCPMRVFTGDNGFCCCGEGEDDGICKTS